MPDPDLVLLREAARRALDHAYVPYSHYPVGCAILTADGTMFTAANVENASYGLTLCAERGAVVQAASRGHREVRAVAVAALHGSSAPCGACRQVLAEFTSLATPVTFQCADGLWIVRAMGELLPDAFSLRPEGPSTRKPGPTPA